MKIHSFLTITEEPSEPSEGAATQPWGWSADQCCVFKTWPWSVNGNTQLTFVHTAPSGRKWLLVWSLLSLRSRKIKRSQVHFARASNGTEISATALTCSQWWSVLCSWSCIACLGKKIFLSIQCLCSLSANRVWVIFFFSPANKKQQRGNTAMGPRMITKSSAHLEQRQTRSGLNERYFSP